MLKATKSHSVKVTSPLHDTLSDWWHFYYNCFTGGKRRGLTRMFSLLPEWLKLLKACPQGIRAARLLIKVKAAMQDNVTTWNTITITPLSPALSRSGQLSVENFQQIIQVKYYPGQFLSSGTNQVGSSEIERLWVVRDRVPRTFLLGCDDRVKETANLKRHA